MTILGSCETTLILEYAVQVWNPHLVMDKNLLEKVQKSALRVCAQSYNYTYEELLSEVPTLQNRRLLYHYVHVLFLKNLSIMPCHHASCFTIIMLKIISITTEFLLPIVMLLFYIIIMLPFHCGTICLLMLCPLILYLCLSTLYHHYFYSYNN